MKIAILTKPVDEIVIDDIEEIVQSELPEGETIEFKRKLPTTKGNPESWANNGTISEKSKNEILEEVTAFSNSYGGVLVLGIE